jgi:hypothetical protein
MSPFLKRLLDKLAVVADAWRDRVVVTSQVGKRKLDVTFTRRELDAKLQELGERYGALAGMGRVVVPEELKGLLDEIRALEKRLRQEEEDIASLRSETKREETTN